jgi:DNA-binding CsgD family transcriptional regulator
MHTEIQPFWHWSLWAKALPLGGAGQSAGRSGDHGGARRWLCPDLLTRASITYRRAGRAMNAASAAREAAALLAAAGRRREASVLLAEAIAIFDAAGARRDLAGAQALGLDSGQGHRSGRAHGDPRRLTPAQLKVAALVAEGLTSAEIGRRLFISRRTVEGHLARIYTALGGHSRVELAMRFAGASAGAAKDQEQLTGR